MKGPDKDLQPDPLAGLREILISLNLTTLARELHHLLSNVETTVPGYSDFLLQALEIEKATRSERSLERRLRMSHLGPFVSIDDFDFSIRPQLHAQAVRELATGRFVDEKRNVILVGRPSTGKTTVARAIGHAVCRAGYSVLKTDMADMLTDLRAAKADGTFAKAFRRLMRPDLLVIDDAGFATLTKEKTDLLFRVVSLRYQEKSIIVATNLPFKKWSEFIPSPAQAVAIADRLIHDATVLRFTGKPMRPPREVLGSPLEPES